MIIESLNEYLHALAGYVLDDDKLVTYKWLSKELEVHVNVAKQILWEFWHKHHVENTIESTIMLMGFLKEGGMRVEVVKESGLTRAKEKFSKIISEHIYSVQKALPDINLLAISGEGDVRYSAIKCDACIERDEEELSQLRWGAASKDHIEADKKEEANGAKKEEVASKASDVNGQRKSTEDDSSTTKKSPGSQQAGLSNFFGKSTQKQKSPTTSTKAKSQSSIKPSHHKKESPTEKKPASTHKKGSKNGIDSFFSKSIQKAEEKKKRRSVSPEKKPASPETKKSATPETKKSATPETKKSATPETKKSATPERKNSPQPQSPEPQKRAHSLVQKEQVKGKKNAHGVKRNRSKEQVTVRKRKRIVIDEDSSDTDPFVSDSEEQDLPPSPERTAASPPKAKSPTLSPVKHEGDKRKILRLKDKTFQDEDGYLVTQKVHVYESCSEDEVEVAKSKPAPKPEQPESKYKKKKQATLMNFFKK